MGEVKWDGRSCMGCSSPDTSVYVVQYLMTAEPYIKDMQMNLPLPMCYSCAAAYFYKTLYPKA